MSIYDNDKTQPSNDTIDDCQNPQNLSEDEVNQESSLPTSGNVIAEDVYDEELSLDESSSEHHNEHTLSTLEEETSPSMLRSIAKFFSSIFSPLLVPTYGIIIALNLSYIAPLSHLKVRIIASLAVLLMTCVGPSVFILYLYHKNKLSDLGVNKQNERIKPYIITILSYTICLIYLDQIQTPRWVINFILGGALAAITSALINLKWKISAHGAAIGGLVALVLRMWTSQYALFNFMPIVMATILIAGIVGTSRLVLRCHTVEQVLAGTLNGFLWVYFMTM